MKSTVQKFDPRQDMRSDTIEVFHYNGMLPVDVDVHYHDFYEVYLFLKGNSEYWIEGRRVPMAPGDLILISPSVLHRSVVLPEAVDYERIVLWINKDFIHSLSTPETDLTKCFERLSKAHINRVRPTGATLSPIASKLSELVGEYCEDKWGREACISALFVQFMIELNRLVEVSVQKSTKESEDGLVLNVLTYINENYMDEISLDFLAEKFFVSKYHLSHSFRREVGVSPYRYITLKRLLSAREMLLSGVPAGEVSYSCGFGDYAGFWRAFKSEYGISPKDFVQENN